MKAIYFTEYLIYPMRNFLFILITIILSNTCFGQKAPDTLKVLAQQIEAGEGSKIYIARYNVLKALEGDLKTSTILVGYAAYQGINHSSEPVLLTLLKYQGNTSLKNYYHYPNYNALEGAEIVNLFRIDRDYWEGCETGIGVCEPLTFYRTTKIKKTFLIAPCGGTSTTISLLSQSEVLFMNTLGVEDCPSVFDLTKLADGKYRASMLSCGLGGDISFRLRTK